MSLKQLIYMLIIVSCIPKKSTSEWAVSDLYLQSCAQMHSHIIARPITFFEKVPVIEFSFI